eukprot:TRINITY_DN5533_c0_g1_i1.p1 TRINITY_DN5533_c0_g1~~TRINITY_DN5533_c0_g1_i1.p1  ORF type:complete len:431 (-),score=95.96 TRINITY_DN5533_c0_g1_i1:99-1391(-)
MSHSHIKVIPNEVLMEEEDQHEHVVQEEKQEGFTLFAQEQQVLDKPAPVIGEVQMLGAIQLQQRFRIALVTTDRYRKLHEEQFKIFITTHLRWIIAKRQGQSPSDMNFDDDANFASDDCLEFEVWTTGHTYIALIEHFAALVETGRMKRTELDAVRRRVVALPPKTKGIVAVTYELVEGRMGCIFHLCDYKDINVSHALAVLKRQALVHDVLYTDTAQGAEAIIRSWKRKLEGNSKTLIVKEREKKKSRAGNTLDIDKLREKSSKSTHRIIPGSNESVTDYNNNIALIAHDGKKLDLCCFVLENMQKLLQFDHLICTGTTGSWLRKFLEASLQSVYDAERKAGKTPKEIDLTQKLRICESGPNGGDVQIAHAALSGLCSRVIFLIDPMNNHPHEVDIRFFEEAVESSAQYPVHLATNIESASYLLASLVD